MRLFANERQTVWETVVEKLPAAKIEAARRDEETIEGGHSMQSQVELQWHIRYLKGVLPKASWRLIDEYGITHELIAPAVEIGRRQGWLLKTKQVQ